MLNVESRRGVLEGTTDPHATIEGINLSSAVCRRLRIDDTLVITKADEKGRFAGALADFDEGDLVRLACARDVQSGQVASREQVMPLDRRPVGLHRWVQQFGHFSVGEQHRRVQQYQCRVVRKQRRAT